MFREQNPGPDSLIAAAFLLTVICRASAWADTSSEFTLGLEGWSPIPASQHTWISDGGNPGGYLRFIDSLGGRSKICAPQEYLGDLSAPGLAIGYDFRIFETGFIAAVLPHEIEIRDGAGNTTVWTQPVGDIVDVWQSVTAPLVEEHWSAVADWANLLGNVQELCIYTEYIDNTGGGTVDEAGFDNIRLSTLDSDGDGVSDGSDNCTVIENSDQIDSDGDGHGNQCDADLNQDCIVNVVDLGILRSRFFSGDSDADFNVDGAVNVIDLGIMRTNFFAPPGPSASGLCGLET